MIDSSFFVAELAYWLLFALAWVGQAAILRLARDRDEPEVKPFSDSPYLRGG
jgi:hypothetical protein